MPFCENCGKEVKPTSKFCGRCGASVNVDLEMAPAGAPEPVSVAPQPEQQVNTVPKQEPVTSPSEPVLGVLVLRKP